VFDTLNTPVYAITGFYTHRPPRQRKELARMSDRFTLLGSFPLDPWDVRILDDLTPRQAHRYRAHPDSTFVLKLFLYTPVHHKMGS
jgi:hypothetical protein